MLIQGTGGVSIFGLQLAVASGATVIATSSSDEKLKLAKSLGAAHTINYKKTPNWAEEVLKIVRPSRPHCKENMLTCLTTDQRPGSRPYSRSRRTGHDHPVRECYPIWRHDRSYWFCSRGTYLPPSYSFTIY